MRQNRLPDKKKKNNNNKSSDMESVPDHKAELAGSYSSKSNVASVSGPTVSVQC